jgi:uncharacterized protein YecT (DUF1311 family)
MDTLERLYQRLLKDATINVAALRESQRSWLKYQKQTCKLYELKSASEGRSVARASSFVIDDPSSSRGAARTAPMILDDVVSGLNTFY